MPSGKQLRNTPDVPAVRDPMPFKRTQLRYFVVVAEEGQITRAAIKLNIAQPALSQSITNLEAQVGFKLFERHARGITLTPAGGAFLVKARSVVAAAQELDRAVDSMARAVAGTIAFGYAALPPWQSAPQLVEAFTAAQPEVRLDLKELGFPVVPASAWLADVDVILVSPLTSDPEIWVEPVLREPRAVVVSSFHPLAGRSEVTVAEVLDETFIALEATLDPLWRSFWTFDNERGGPPRQSSPNPSASAQERFAMIASGLGITAATVGQAQIIENALSGVSAIPVSDAERVPMSLVGRKDRLNPLIEELRAVARQVSEQSEPEMKIAV